MALFERGNKAGGRRKGSKNKLKKAITICEELNFSPFHALITAWGKLPPGPTKVKLLIEITKLVYPSAKEEPKADSPKESVENAKQLLEELKKFDEPTINRTSLEDGQSFDPSSERPKDS
jgi:hypothetical protein